MGDRGSTKHRRLILDILAKADSHLRAKDIYRKALEEDPEISLATVYRNLRLFEELGLVNGKRLDRMRCWYELKRSGDHCDVICSACGRSRIREPAHRAIAERGGTQERLQGDQGDPAPRRPLPYL